MPERSNFVADGNTPVPVTGTSVVSFRFILLSFIIGLLAGTTGDFVHVLTETTGYPADGPFPFIPFLPARMPVWVPFEFGIAVCVMALSHKLLSHLYQPRMAGNRILALAAPALFVLIYALTGIVKTGPGWQDLWLICVTILLWWLLDRSFMGIACALLVALCGTGFEIFLVSVGGFYYNPHIANFYGVASWLPWLYMAASICVSLMVRWMR